MSTVGVVIPCRNYEMFLPDALASVRAQGDVKAVVVDDYSSNPYAVRQAAGETPVLHLPEHRGLGAARNIGAAYLGTEFLLFLDADDTLYPGAVDALRQALERDERNAFAYGNYVENGVAVLTFPDWNDPYLVRALNPTAYCQLWRSAAFWGLGGYSEIPVAEDWELIQRAAGAGYKGTHIDAMILDHRLHGDAPGEPPNKWTTDAAQYGGMAGVVKEIATWRK